jgi:release factor glutamine methyltransferase
VSAQVDPGTVAEALALARALGVERLDAQLLLAHHHSRPRAWLLAHAEAALPPAIAAAVATGLHRRAAGEPLAYVLGHAEFRGLRLAVGPDVLIPRPETELLVEWALECLNGVDSPRVLDLGTGSGAIVLALGAARSDARLHASDLSPDALAVARRNATALGQAVRFAEGPWWQPWAGERFDLVVANPPYVAEGDRHLAALGHEPLQALTAGPQGLDDLRAIVDDAWPHLRPGAWLLMEHGHDQGDALRALLAAAGLQGAQTRRDLAGLDRCTGARRPAEPML